MVLNGRGAEDSASSAPNFGSLRKTGIRHFQSRSRLRTTSSKAVQSSHAGSLLAVGFMYSSLFVRSVGSTPVPAVNSTPPMHVGPLLGQSTRTSHSLLSWRTRTTPLIRGDARIAMQVTLASGMPHKKPGRLRLLNTGQQTEVGIGALSMSCRCTLRDCPLPYPPPWPPFHDTCRTTSI